MFQTRVLTADVVAELVAGYNNGTATLSSIAAKVGCSVPTAGRLLKKNGATMRAKGRPKGSKTVNRKPVTVTATMAQTPSVPVETLTDEKLAAGGSSFADFQQRVLNYNA